MTFPGFPWRYEPCNGWSHVLIAMAMSHNVTLTPIKLINGCCKTRQLETEIEAGCCLGVRRSPQYWICVCVCVCVCVVLGAPGSCVWTRPAGAAGPRRSLGTGCGAAPAPPSAAGTPVGATRRRFHYQTRPDRAGGSRAGILIHVDVLRPNAPDPNQTQTRPTLDPLK